MSKEERRQQPIVSYSDSDTDDPERGQVLKSEHTPTFNFGQTVYIRATNSSVREGPYKIERVVPNSGNTTFKFKLCNFVTLDTAKDGREYSARELERETQEQSASGS